MAYDVLRALGFEVDAEQEQSTDQNDSDDSSGEDQDAGEAEGDEQVDTDAIEGTDGADTEQVEGEEAPSDAEMDDNVDMDAESTPAGEQWSPDVSGRNSNDESRYRAFTNEFDEVVEAEELWRDELNAFAPN